MLLGRDLASGEFSRRRIRFYTVGIPVFLLAFLRTVPHAFALRNNVIEGSARKIECHNYPLARLQLRAGHEQVVHWVWDVLLLALITFRG